LSDLPVELIDLAFDQLARLVVFVKEFCGTVEQLTLPGGGHCRVDIETDSQLRGGLFIRQGRQSDFGLELGTVLFSLLAHF
jgi:hypothetical protein